MGDHGDRMSTKRLVFFRCEVAAHERLDTQHIEVIPGNEITPKTFVASFMTNADRSEAIRDQTRKHIVAVAIIFVIEIRLDRIVSAVVERAINFSELLRM